MSDNFPGPRTRSALERGIPLFKNGARFDVEMERAGRRGFRSVRQIVIDRAEGDFIWDLDGKRYIDFAAGIAVVNTGHCHAKPMPRARMVIPMKANFPISPKVL